MNEMKKILFLACVFMFLVGCGNEEAQAEVDGEVVNLEELKTLLSEEEANLRDLEEKVKSTENKLLELDSDFEERETEFEELIKLAENKDSYESEVENAESSLKKLNEEIEEAESELEKLNGQIVSFEDEPIKVGAGYFYFGEDIEPGRYELKAQSGHRGNIFIRREGSSYVSETFGKPRSGGGEELTFVFTALAGDEVEATIPFELYPAE
jgi:septal ring factor EnvC (AmiA/AmiB activator)